MIDPNDLQSLLTTRNERFCVSLYQPTPRRHPENQQDPIRFRNLVKEAETSLGRVLEANAIDPILAPLRALADDADFWNHTHDGLAIFVGPEQFRLVHLQRPVAELLVVAESFHVKPLLRIVQSADRYQVLSVNRRDIRLFEGNRDVLDEIALSPGVPSTITDALGEELTTAEGQVHSYGTGPVDGAGASRGPGGAKTGGHGHGHGSKKDEIEKDTERFFRAVDKAILELHSKPSGLPLILAALPEYHAPFHAISYNPHLVAKGIEVNADTLAPDELRARAWKVMEPFYIDRLAQLVERFGAARSAQRGDDRLPQVAQAAASGRIDTLLLQAERAIPGRLDVATGDVQCSSDMTDPAVDDVLDDLAQRVLVTGGKVVIVPTDRMPTDTGLAAIYRYPTPP